MTEIARTAVMRQMGKAPLDDYVVGARESCNHLCGIVLRQFFDVPKTSPAIVLIAHEKKVNGSYAVVTNQKDWRTRTMSSVIVNTERLFISPSMNRYISGLLHLRLGQRRTFYVTCEYDDAPAAADRQGE